MNRSFTRSDRASVAKNRFGKGDQSLDVEQLDVAVTDLDQAIGIEALDNPADRFRCQSQVTCDIRACHRQGETRR